MKKKNAIIGIVLLGLGIFAIIWSINHSPQDGLFEKLGRELQDSYTMSEPAFYASLVGGAVTGVIGLLKLLKSIK